MMQEKVLGVKNKQTTTTLTPMQSLYFIVMTHDYYVFHNFNVISHKSEFESNNWDFFKKIHNRLYISVFIYDIL